LHLISTSPIQIQPPSMWFQLCLYWLWWS